MNQRLFQDAGGTTPAIIAGQPVGLIKRLAGSVDAVQATALSKPTLARWPKAGVRMLQNQNVWSDFPLGPTMGGFSRNGLRVSLPAVPVLTTDILGRGFIDGLPYIDVRFHGTNGENIGFYNFVNDHRVALLGRQIVVKAGIQVIAGSISNTEANSAIRLFTNYLDAGGLTVNGWNIACVVNETMQFFERTSAPPSNAVEAAARGVYLRIAVGATVDVTLRVLGLQSEFGLNATPFQTVYSPNDITEPGVADLWHLYNDGGDSLNVTLPAGTYGLASIDINRAITVTTITSDGTTPINTLRHERQLDVILRAGAFSSGEEIAIRDYWGRVFA